MTADTPRAQLIHIETDRRLGHEWDEWDGRPLPGNGDFSAPPGLFFRFAALTIGIGMAVGAALIFLLGPRLRTPLSMLPPTPWPHRPQGARARDRKSTTLKSRHRHHSSSRFCFEKK